MKNNLMTIIKKELARFFGDKRMVFTTILMPGLLIYIMYSFMGSGLTSKFEADEDYTYRIYAENMPSTVSSMIKGSDINVEYLDRDGVSEDDMKQAVTDKDAELLMVFPENFEADVQAYDSMTATTPAPQVALYYNSANTESTACYQIMASVLDGYESSMANKFDVNSGDTEYDLASKEDSTGQIFSMMLPMLLMIFLFSGCMAIAPESIAGEKERGTIATLLVTPMKRGQLAMGKIISLGIIGLLSGISSFVGTMLSLPKLMGAESEAMDASVYSVTDYVLLLMVILTTVLVLVGALAVISAFAKTVKEAGSMIMPLMVVVMVISITSMLGSGAPKEFYWYLIPFYNSVQSMTGIFDFSYSGINIVACLVSNLIYTGILSTVLAKMFGSEKIMYS
ncbi:MAG: ABC transporter permease [Lachnospiraceae bacterium]|nr:ABC transporter permease [Lachnospiraceae bacterium]MDD6303513.1 ABC transporter permease [Lachnospiraceae bacterium]HCJ74910.1 ABC transporter permease [Roseburia sp.]